MTNSRETCPLCAAALTPSLAYGPSVGGTGNGRRPSRHEERSCPSCGAELYRTGGGPWLPSAGSDPSQTGVATMLRFANKDDMPFLKWMLFEASYSDPDHRPSFDLGLSDPEIAMYLEGWPQPGEIALIATNANNTPLGAAWYRLFTSDRPGFGFIDEQTPEVVLAVRPDARGQGLGTRLLESLIQAARKQGHRKISLAVQHTNTGARRLYERLGFAEIGRNEEDSKMVLELSPDSTTD